MNPKLRALFEQHKKTLAIVGAAGVGGLALLKARSGGTAAPAAPGASTASQLSAAVKPTGTAIGGYAPADSSASDVYSALSPQLDRLTEMFGQLSAPVPVPAPPPIASTIFEATGQGSYLQNNAGGWLEVQRDGSIFGLGARDIERLGLGRSGGPAYQRLKVEDIPAYYTLPGNLAAAGAGTKAQRWQPTKQADGKYTFTAVG